MKRLLLSLITVALTGTSSTHAQFGLENINISKVAEGATKMAKGASGIGTQEEIAIGGSVAVEIVSKYGGLWKNADATRRAQLIGRTVAAACDRPGLTYYFGILDSDSVNAFSAPGGYVFITKGAYEAAANDDQLAGVLAHEIAHVTRRHALRIISRNEFVSGMTSVAAGSSSDFAQYDMGIDKISNTLFTHGYDSGSEFDADRVAAWTAYSAGYAKDGLRTFLQGLKSGHGSTFSTHPDLNDRIARLAKAGY